MQIDLDTVANILDTVAKMAAGLGLTQPWMVAVAAVVGLAAASLHIAAKVKASKSLSAAEVAQAASALAPQVDAAKDAVKAALEASKAAPVATLPAFGAATAEELAAAKAAGTTQIDPRVNGHK